MIKKIEYLIPELITPYIKENYELFSQFLTLFGKYLDDHNFGKILNIEDNLYAYTIYSELLDYFLDEIFNETFNFDVVNLSDDNKKRFIDLAYKISSTKGTQQGFYAFLKSLLNFSIATESGTYILTSYDVDIDDVSLFYYELNVTTTSYDSFEAFLPSIHPAGIQYDIIGARYDGTYLYNNTIYYSGELI